MSTITFDPSNPSIDDIMWTNAYLLDSGTFASVYRVAPGFVIKTGDVDIKEVKQQKYLNSHGLALPVLDYDEDSILTYEISSIGEIPDGMEQEYAIFMDEITDKWGHHSLCELDNHNKNWGVWENPDTGQKQFVWLDCDPDWLPSWLDRNPDLGADWFQD